MFVQQMVMTGLWYQKGHDHTVHVISLYTLSSRRFLQCTFVHSVSMLYLLVSLESLIAIALLGQRVCKQEKEKFTGRACTVSKLQARTKARVQEALHNVDVMQYRAVLLQAVAGRPISCTADDEAPPCTRLMFTD